MRVHKINKSTYTISNKNNDKTTQKKCMQRKQTAKVTHKKKPYKNTQRKHIKHSLIKVSKTKTYKEPSKKP